MKRKIIAVALILVAASCSFFDKKTQTSPSKNHNKQSEATKGKSSTELQVIQRKKSSEEGKTNNTGKKSSSKAAAKTNL